MILEYILAPSAVLTVLNSVAISLYISPIAILKPSYSPIYGVRGHETVAHKTELPMWEPYKGIEQTLVAK